MRGVGEWDVGRGRGRRSRHKNNELIDFAFLLGIKKNILRKFLLSLKNDSKITQKSYLIGLKASLDTEVHYFGQNQNLKHLGKNGSAISEDH